MPFPFLYFSFPHGQCTALLPYFVHRAPSLSRLLSNLLCCVQRLSLNENTHLPGLQSRHLFQNGPPEEGQKGLYGTPVQLKIIHPKRRQSRQAPDP